MLPDCFVLCLRSKGNIHETFWISVEIRKSSRLGSSHSFCTIVHATFILYVLAQYPIPTSQAYALLGYTRRASKKDNN